MGETRWKFEMQKELKERRGMPPTLTPPTSFPHPAPASILGTKIILPAGGDGGKTNNGTIGLGVIFVTSLSSEGRQGEVAGRGVDQGAGDSAQLQGQTSKEKFRERFPGFGLRCEFLGPKRGRQTRALASGISGPGHRVMGLSRGAKEKGPPKAGAAGGWVVGKATGLWPQLCPHAPPTYPWVSWHQIPARVLQLHVTDAGG